MIEAAARFVPAADEVWRLQRGEDDECRFFQSFANRGHYRAEGGSRQGIYVVTPGGELLASANALDPERVLALLDEALALWESLGAEERLPEPSSVAPRGRFEDLCPEDGLVLVSVARDLPPDLDPAAEPLRPSNVDHVWLDAGETAALFGEGPHGEDDGVTVHLPGVPRTFRLGRRLARFHLVDVVRGQALPFAESEVRRARLDVEVVDEDDEHVRYRLRGSTQAVADGRWRMGDNDWRPDRPWPRSVETVLSGSATWSKRERRCTELELVALGWRTGRTAVNGRGEGDEGPIGFRFTLAEPGDRVPPAFLDVYDAGWARR